MGSSYSGQLRETVNLLLRLRWFESITSHMKKSNAGVAQLVERQPSKLKVAGSRLVSRSKKDIERVIKLFFNLNAEVAQW